MLLAGEEKFVELRRLHRGARQHGMRLAAVVNLVLEEMFQNRGNARRWRRSIGPRQHQTLGERMLALARTEGEQPPVAGDLGVIERGGVGKVRWRIVVAL